MRLLFEFAELLWPARCLLCSQAAVVGPCCAAHALPVRCEGSRCPRCAERLPDAISDGALCAPCRRRPPAFQRALACWDYWGQPTAREHILAAKHRGHEALRVSLARQLGEAFERLQLERPLLVPVPAHPSRYIERGQGLVGFLAHEVAARCGGEHAPVLKKVRPTRSQGDPLVVDRRRNVRGTISHRRRAEDLSLTGREVWVVDDVLTSGATASECARALHKLGARNIGVCVLARASAAR